MATSGTATINFDVNEIIQEAWERATGGQDIRSGYQLRTARRSLNILLMEWANKGLNLFTIEQITIPLSVDTPTYDLPTDTVDIIEHVLREGSGNQQRDSTLTRISVSTYAALTNKLTRGRPNQLYVDRQSTPRITVYPVPESDTYTLQAWRLRRIQDAQTGANTMDMPFRFVPALVAGLAYHIAMKVPEGAQRLPVLEAVYNQTWQQAADEDRDRASVMLVPYGGR